MSGKLNGRTALITGASRGLGKAMAIAMGAEGARLALVSRSPEQLNGVAREVREKGGEAHVFQADVSREDHVQQLEKGVSAALGRIQILINNAGINIRKP